MDCAGLSTGTITSRSGHITTGTTFTFEGAGSPDNLDYTSTGSVSAFIMGAGQLAYAKEYSLDGSNEIDVLNTTQYGGASTKNWRYSSSLCSGRPYKLHRVILC